MIMGEGWLPCKKELSRIGLFTFKNIQFKDVIIEVYKIIVSRQRVDRN